MSTQNSELMTPEQVAELLQVHPGTLENWRFRGEGPAFFKLGNKRRSPVRYRRKDVEDWIFTDMKKVKP
jgi:predicted site-specific integrase-resolvase